MAANPDIVLPSPAAGAPLPEIVPGSVDLTRVIRRSMRCFAFGLVGLIPGLGLSLAIQAIRLQREVARETGESWRPTRLNLYVVVTLAGIGVQAAGHGGLVALLTTEVFVLLGALVLWEDYVRTAPTVANPARRYLFWGLGLAYGGCFILSAFIIIQGVAYFKATWGH